MVWIISWRPENIGPNNYISMILGSNVVQKLWHGTIKILNAGDAHGNRGQQLDVHLQDEA